MASFAGDYVSFGSVYENDNSQQGGGSKFIGGAERARREAQKKRHRPQAGWFLSRPTGDRNQTKRARETAPTRDSLLARVLACLLTSSVDEDVDATVQCYFYV